MKTKNKKKIFRYFIFSFIGIFSMFVLTDHFFYGKNHRPPLSWQQIQENLDFYLIFSFFGAILFIIMKDIKSNDDKTIDND